MDHMKRIFALLFWLTYGGTALAQTEQSDRLALLRQTAVLREAAKEPVPLDAQRERQALSIFLKSVQDQIVSAAEAMPATKYEFIPTEGEFKGVRTFARQVRHLSATNHILAAAA